MLVAGPSRAEVATPEVSTPIGHTLGVTVSTSDHGPLFGRLAYGARIGSFGVGLDLGVSWAQRVAIEGYIVPDATRLRARVPLLLHLGGSSRLTADLVVAGGVRSMFTAERSVLAATADVAFIAQFAVTDSFRLHTGTVLPLAFDLTGGRELAGFPGLAVIAGAEVALSPRFSLHAQGMLAAPEGYGGDGAKSVLEFDVSFRVRFGEVRQPTWVVLPEAL